MGEKSTAVELLQKAPENPLITIWNAYLNKDASMLPASSSPALIFPYRRETLAALEWAASANSDWKFKYYLALNYWAKGREAEASTLLRAIGQNADYAPFYLTRAALLKNDDSQVLADLQKAYQLDPEDWRTGYQLIEFYDRTKNYKQALELATNAYRKFKDNFSIALLYAKQLMNDGQYEACIKILKNTTILPFEGSGQGKVVYRQALLQHALQLMNDKKYQQAITKIEASKLWPENLGAGKPFDSEIDERLEDWLAYQSYTKLGKKDAANQSLNKILSFNPYNRDNGNPYASPNNLVSAWAMQKSGKPEQATALLQNWIKAQPANAIAKWALDVYNGNHTEMPEELLRNERFKIWNTFINSSLYK